MLGHLIAVASERLSSNPKRQNLRANAVFVRKTALDRRTGGSTACSPTNSAKQAIDFALSPRSFASIS